MNWMNCQSIFNNISEESKNQQYKFKSPMSSIVGEFYRQIMAVPEDRRELIWNHSGGSLQKWAQEELFIMGYADQRFKYSRNGQTTEIEFMTQNLMAGSPIETLGEDTLEVVLQAFYIALKDSSE